MTLNKGAKVDSITAKNQDGEEIDIGFDDLTVIYFYPKDDTPGCAVEAEQFNMELDIYRDAGVQVFGVSLDDVDSHCDFADKYGLEFDLLADPDGGIADVFDVDTSDGYTDRTTFIVRDGEVVSVYEGVNPDGHAREVMSDLMDAGLVDPEI